MRQLKAFRAAYCIALALAVAVSLFRLSDLLPKFLEELGPEQPRFLPALAFAGELSQILLRQITLSGFFLMPLLLAAGLIQKGARFALALSILGLVFFGGVFLSATMHFQRSGQPSRVLDLVFPVLLLLLLEPGRDEVRSRKVLMAIKLSLGLVYFGSGLAKIYGGETWLNGEALRAYLLWAHFKHGSAFSLWLGQSLSLCALLSLATLLFELAAPVLVLKWPRLFLVSAALFHLAAELLLRVNFVFPFFAPVFLIFIPWDKLKGWRLIVPACLFLLAALEPISFASVEDPYRAPHFQCFEADSKLLFRMKSGCKGSATNPDGSSVRYEINEMGLHAPNFPPFAPKGVVRVLLLGNSLWVPHREGSSVPQAFAENIEGHRRVEVINASVNGYSLAQSFLQLPSLLDRYHPHLVIALGNATGNGLTTFFHHRIATERTSDGLASSLGPQKNFWPLPSSWENWIWSKSWSFRAIIWSQAIRQFFELSKARFLGAPAPESVYAMYLLALAKVTSEHGTAFAVVREEKSEKDRGRILWYKPDSIATNLWPGSLFPRGKIEDIYRGLAKKGVTSIDLAPIVQLLNPLGAARDYDIPDDIHLTSDGMQLHGRALAAALRPLLDRLPVGIKSK